MRRIFVLAAVAAALALCIGTAWAAPEGAVIYRGSDFWSTPGDGGTGVDFSLNPIPAGFFCSGSAPFSARIEFRGRRIQTDPPGVFGNADTILERLDDAAFDENGIARTRLQMRALSLVSIEPIQTECGSYVVTVGLEGEQPVTEMQIVRDGTIGGYFLAPIDLNARISFWPLGMESSDPAQDANRRIYRPLQIVQSFHLNPNPQAGWTSHPGPAGVRHEGSAMADLDGDGRAETRIMGTSNFAVGWWDNGGVPLRSNIYLLGDELDGSMYLTHNPCHVIDAAIYDKGGKDWKR